MVIRHRIWAPLAAMLVCCSFAAVGAADRVEREQSSVTGVYLESRTCQVYTGPCFANGEEGLTGHDAIMAWQIQSGDHEGVDLSGLNVVVVVHAARTIGHQGLPGATPQKSVILVDERADDAQREALLAFVADHASGAAETVTRVAALPIEMELDLGRLEGRVQAGTEVIIESRKARPDDCICGNESAYYPPLVELDQFVAAVTIENAFRGRGLGSRWSLPDSRSGYIATFRY